MNLDMLKLSEINDRIENDKDRLIAECEKHYENQINFIAEKICENNKIRLVLLAGPSSSGKTTTAHMIAKKLQEKGKKAKAIPFDDFYFDQDNTYKFEDGTIDLETIKSLDTDLLVQCLKDLIEKGETLLPEFDFMVRKRKKEKKIMSLDKDEIIILEGLHALNPIITSHFDEETMMKLYVSVSSRIYDDESNVVFSKRDLRFIRRLVRDFHYRNSDVENTYYLWKGVLMGEDRYIFPFSHLARYKIDSIHAYEICVFKHDALMLLNQVKPESIYYEKAKQMIEKFDKIISMSESEVVEGSLLKEFIKLK